MWSALIDPGTTAYIANKPPALFGILPIYGLLAAFGFVLSFSWAYIEWNKKGHRNWDFFQVVTFSTIFALYGAKIWYMVFDPVNAFAGVNDILDILIIVFIPSFGRSIIGTIVFAPIGIIIWKKYWGPDLKTLEIMDILLPSIAIAQAFARWGNFANHQVYGGIVSEESLNWLPSFIQNNMHIVNMDDGTVGYRSPLFLYESFADLATFIFIIIIFKTNNCWKEGTAGMFYIGTYGVNRASTELFRDPAFQMHWGPIPTSFVAAIFLIIIGYGIMFYLQYGNNFKAKFKKKNQFYIE